jgi:G3E family GTPase
VALADRLIITKSDQVDAGRLSQLRATLATLAPLALIGVAHHGEIDPAFVTEIGLDNAGADAARIDRWLGIAQPTGNDGVESHHHHDAAIQTFTLRFGRPFTARAFEQSIEVLTGLRGPDLLRVKGLVNIEGEAGPIVVQGVQHLFHPPVAMSAWPDADRASRLVFITRGISREVVTALFSAVAAIAAT